MAYNRKKAYDLIKHLCTEQDRQRIQTFLEAKKENPRSTKRNIVIESIFLKYLRPLGLRIPQRQPKRFDRMNDKRIQ